MPIELTPAQTEKYLAVARRAAARVSRDPQVIEEASGHAVVQLARCWDGISTGEPERQGWVSTTAANYAKRLGAKLNKPLPDEALGNLIHEMRLGAGSVGSFVALIVDFNQRWALLGGETRVLLHAKYVEGKSSKEIANDRGRSETAVAIDHKLTAAKKAARPVFEDLFDEMRGQHPTKEGADR